MYITVRRRLKLADATVVGVGRKAVSKRAVLGGSIT